MFSSSETQTVARDSINPEQSASRHNDDDKNNPDGDKESTITRKRQSDPNVWKKNACKNKRASGIEHTDSTGKQRQEKAPKSQWLGNKEL